MAEQPFLRLCVDTGHPIDPCNRPGPIHCTAHPHGSACTTAIYVEKPGTRDSAADRQAAST